MVAKTAGVISTPHRVSRSTKDGPCKVLVLASDGLWDFVPNEEAIAIASQAPDARTAAVRVVAMLGLLSCPLPSGCFVL
jgi:serine/threonine protein phosphatase PrpC